MRTVFLFFYFFICQLSVSQDLWSEERRLTDYFSQEQIDLANTARDSDYMRPDEKEIYLYNNLVRMFPRAFIPFLFDYVQDNQAYLGKTKRVFKRDYYYWTLLETLETMAPVSALYPHQRMYELATCWAEESGKLGVTGHDRVSCEDAGAENCAYSSGSPLYQVMQLLIDKNVRSLGHRDNMLGAYFHGMGAAIQPHSRYGKVLIQDFSRENDLIFENRAKRKALFIELNQTWTEEEIRMASAPFDSLTLDSLNREFYFYLNLYRQFPAKFKDLYTDNYIDFDQTIDEIKEGYYADKISALIQRPVGPVLEPIAFPQRTLSYAKCAVEYIVANDDFSFDFSETCRTDGVSSGYISTSFPSNGYDLLMDFLVHSPESLAFDKNEAIIFSYVDDYGIELHTRWW